MSILAKVKAQRKAALGETPAPSPVFPPLSPGEVREHNERVREEIDTYFSGPIMAALTRLHAEGRLAKDGLDCPEWREVEAEWVKASEDSPLPCDVERVKALMRDFIKERGGSV